MVCVVSNIWGPVVCMVRDICGQWCVEYVAWGQLYAWLVVGRVICAQASAM